MAVEKTLSIIKPDAVTAKSIGKILAAIEERNLKIIALKMTHMSETLAREFYAAHADKPFFKDLIAFMTSGPVVVSVLEGENAVIAYRELMGATDPRKALPATLRARFGTNIDKNAVHGSDAVSSAHVEIGLLFPEIQQ